MRTAKGGNLFCLPDYIDRESEKLFQTLAHPPFTVGGSRAAFIEDAAQFLSELNVIHCFREGNGRAQLTFMHMIGERAGHALKLENVKEATFLPAMIASFSGELAPLKRELKLLAAS